MNEKRKHFIKSTLNSPRVTSLLSSFEAIQSGREQVPHTYPQIEQGYLDTHPDFETHNAIFSRNIGTFYKHYLSSVPYLRENMMRVDIALKNFAELKHGEPLAFWAASSGEGTRERALAEFTNGQIMTLHDSPNLSSKREFERLLTHGNSFFHHGCWVDINPTFLQNNPYSSVFENGFDIIWENNTFQMYGKNRDEQIAYIAESLKPNGLVLLLEKLIAPNIEDTVRMENMKTEFKSAYFDEESIRLKEQGILKTMHNQLVTLEELTASLQKTFRNAVLIWNAGNFYEIAASNSQETLHQFVDSLPEPYVPNNYRLEQQQVRPLITNGQIMRF